MIRDKNNKLINGCFKKTKTKTKTMSNSLNKTEWDKRIYKLKERIN